MHITPYTRGNLLTLLLALLLAIVTKHADSAWTNHGGDITNRRYASGELLINPSTINRLRLKWTFFAGKDISATPAIADGRVYFPSWNGFIYAVNAFNGALIWRQNIGQLTGLPGTGLVSNVNVSVSRSTPSIAGDLLIVPIYGPGVVIAVTRSTGDLVWSTQFDPRPVVVITCSGTVYNGAFYVGVSSLESTLPPSQCCNTRGSLVKLDVKTGGILWRTYTLPDNGGKNDGYAGAAIWGSSPAIDIARGLVYAATGQLYTAPAQVLQCQARQNSQPKPTGPDQCIGADVNFNSIIAFDMNSGNIRWAKNLGGYDVWNFACLVPNNPDCPPGPNVDADFGEAPMLLTVNSNGRLRDIVVAVQKSGFAWALDRDNGEIVWFKLAGPGGNEGGAIWGAATDGIRVYTNIANSNKVNFTLAPSIKTTISGVWVALDAKTGQILWTTENPSKDLSIGPVSLINNILFAGSVAPNGPLYAMDARTGNILWSDNTNATIYGGVSASYGCIYLGNGYSVGLAKLFHPTWTSGTSLYAYCIWVNHGGDLTNRRYAKEEVLINPLTVHKLHLKWKFFAGKDISATPAIADEEVYFPSWNGFLYAVDTFNGALIWKQNIGQLTGLPGTGLIVNVSVSRTTPTISGDLLIVPIYGPGVVIAVTRSTGELVWLTKLDPRPFVVITTSGTVHKGSIYVGVSSLENLLPPSQCCTSRGSLVKLDIQNGAVLWRTYTLPDNGGKMGGYAGASIWGSSPAIDITRGLVYAASGQLYTAPPDVLRCQAEQNKQPKPSGTDQCIGPDIYFNSIIAYDMNSGKVRWAKQLGGYDVWTFACLIPNNPDCPPGPNIDADFGEAPMLLSVFSNGKVRDIVVAVQKSGFAWALDRDTGNIVWFKLAGPGGKEGGGIWGAATDGKRVYTNIANSDKVRFTLAPSNKTTTSGAWVALDANTGQILWTTANPSNELSMGPVSLTNGLLFAGSVASNGPLYAMDARTGIILWSDNTNATIYGGVSAGYGCIFLGNGYSIGLAKFHPTWTAGTSLYAYCIT